MRAAVVPALNGRWEVRDVPAPVPGPNQVVIKIRASGLCYTDVHITEGMLPTRFPRTLGHEPVGEIVALGAAVTTRKVGDRVGVAWHQESCGHCEWCRRGKPLFCPEEVATGIHTQGGHAELMLAHAEATTLIPDGLAWEQAAPIFCAGYTVWSGLRMADPKPHERIAVVGVGGLGHLAVQYARAAGFTTIAVTHSKDKEKMIRELGADEVVADGKGLLGVGGADVILGTSNSYASVSDAFKGLRPDGRIVVMGASGEAIPVTAELIFKRGRIMGSMQNGPEYLHEALDYAARGRVKVIAETYALRDINRAYDRVKSGAVRFRAVITN
jgi:D-arabinose 1-dehydrogenase-like Zn-dependent alcohol dehydrogenase